MKQHDRFWLGDLVAREMRHHDPNAQVHFVGGVCSLLVFLDQVGGLFGVVTVLPSLVVTYRFRSGKAIAPESRDEVAKVLAVENRKFPSSRWFLESVSGEIRFAGEIALRGHPLRDKRLIRRRLFRRLVRMDGKVGRLFVDRPARERCQGV